MERPALKRLLQDIREKRVDVVVVYKIDRLTRSLTDFSKIVEIFDASSVSFVSVTQQFNTTTSMGRLTLNVLLSFAQFEREVTAERIRDKIAASKKKGMWMGGVVPLGYRVENRKLLIDDQEAATVRHLFARYIELKSVRGLADEAKEAGLSTRNRTRRDGSIVVTMPFGRGNLYHLLSNPIYIGKIRHRDQIYDGEHDRIIGSEVFEQAQALLALQAPARKSRTNVKDRHLLTGLLFDEAGDKLRAIHANKKGQRYRYYVSKHLGDGRGGDTEVWRLPASQLDSTVGHWLSQTLGNHAQLSDWLGEWIEPGELSKALKRADQIRADWAQASIDKQKDLLRSAVHRMVLKPGSLIIMLNRAGLADVLADRGITNPHLITSSIISIELPISLRRRGVETKIVLTDGRQQTNDPDAALIHLLIRAHRYLHQLTADSGSSLTDVANANGTDVSEVSRILPLAFLSPKITDIIVAGAQPIELTAQRLSRIGELPQSWSRQIAALGI